METRVPLAKGSDGMPSFHELIENQGKNITESQNNQVQFQQKRLQFNNYQIINFKINPTDATDSQSYFVSNYNLSVAVGTAMTDGILFGSNTKDSDNAKYYNIVYANIRYIGASTAGGNFMEAPSYIEFYLMQKVGGGVFGGKIPRQIEAVKDETNVAGITVSGDEFGVQYFGVDVYNENAYYTQSPDLKGMRSVGLALKRINLNLGATVGINLIEFSVEIGIDLKTVGNNY